jgi:RNA ligase
MTHHPAHRIRFDALVDNLERAIVARLVVKRAGPGGLTMYRYTDRCLYDAAWDDTTIAARGLILSHAERRIVATPFPKFFNYGERSASIPDLPFEATEKIDGTLVIIFHHDGRWRAATRGAFDGPQAKWAQAFLDARDLAPLAPGVTYLAEAIYPENRIVIAYGEATLRLLAAYDAEGVEPSYEEVIEIARALGLAAAERRAFSSVVELAEYTRALPAEQEGFVVRFADGLRLKFKGDAYSRLHALIAGITPLNIWGLIAGGDDLEAIRRTIPEEFWGDFDAIHNLLETRRKVLLDKIEDLVASVRDLSDKEVGLRLSSFDPIAASYVFAVRKKGGVFEDPRVKQKFFRDIRPDGNELDGYEPTSAMNKVLEDLG